jgi:hypothetical protein
MGHGTGDNPQAIIEHSLVVHYHEFYFAFLLPVNDTLLLLDVQSFSHYGIIDNIWSSWHFVEFHFKACLDGK